MKIHQDTSLLPKHYNCCCTITYLQIQTPKRSKIVCVCVEMWKLIWWQNMIWTDINLFVIFLYLKLEGLLHCKYMNILNYSCFPRSTGDLYKKHYIYCVIFLKCEKVWLLKHIQPHRFYIRFSIFWDML